MGERGTPLLEALPAGQPLWRAKGKKKPQGSKRDRCQGHRKQVEATGEQCVGDRQSEKDGGGGADMGPKPGPQKPGVLQSCPPGSPGAAY